MRADVACLDCGKPVRQPQGRGRPVVRCMTHAMLRRKQPLGDGNYHAKVERNAIIIAAWEGGQKAAALGRQYGVSRQRIEQLVKRQERRSKWHRKSA